LHHDPARARVAALREQLAVTDGFATDLPQRDNQAAARHPQHDWAHGAWILNRHVGRGIRQSSTGGGRDADDGLEVGPSPFRNHPVFVSIGVNRASGGLAGVENEDVSRGGRTLVRYLR
jgi:hypothetical protein